MKKPHIAIIDYKAGNIASVRNALTRLDADFELTNNITRLERADGLIFPGVGHARAAMEALQEAGVAEWIPGASKPLLGICLGMQLLFEHTEEGDTRSLGILPGTLKRFTEPGIKVPHMGWNHFTESTSHPLLDGLNAKHYFYYVHSYYAPITEHTLANCHYSVPFASVVGKANFMGVQFHPEKSGIAGEQLLKNFLRIL